MKNTSILKSTFALLTISTALALSPARADNSVPAGYPLKTCPVSSDKLGSQGKPVKMKAPDGTIVYLCCKDCVADFKKNPEKYAKMVKQAEAKK